MEINASEAKAADHFSKKKICKNLFGAEFP
jgi:hypothetical protein